MLSQKSDGTWIYKCSQCGYDALADTKRQAEAIKYLHELDHRLDK